MDTTIGRDLARLDRLPAWPWTRAWPSGVMPDGREVRLDNGQHILIGAYHATLGLLAQLGVDAEAALLPPDPLRQSRRQKSRQALASARIH